MPSSRHQELFFYMSNFVEDRKLTGGPKVPTIELAVALFFGSDTFVSATSIGVVAEPGKKKFYNAPKDQLTYDSHMTRTYLLTYSPTPLTSKPFTNS